MGIKGQRMMVRPPECSQLIHHGPFITILTMVRPTKNRGSISMCHTSFSPAIFA